MGNFLLDIRIFGENRQVPVFDATNLFGDTVSRRWSEDPNAAISEGRPIDFSDTLGLVMQFQIEEGGLKILEPPPLWLMAIPLLLAGAFVYRKNRSSGPS